MWSNLQAPNWNTYTDNSQKIPDIDTDPLEQDINAGFGENSPHQEGVISEIYQRPDRSYFPPNTWIAKLNEYRQTSTKVLAEAGWYRKKLNIIQWKVLKWTHLPLTVKRNIGRIFNQPIF